MTIQFAQFDAITRVSQKVASETAKVHPSFERTDGPYTATQRSSTTGRYEPVQNEQKKEYARA